MKRTVLLYSLALAGLIVLLKMLEYRFLVQTLSLEIYLGIVAILFTVLGIWAGQKITRTKTVLVTQSAFQFDPALLTKTGISKREYEVLELMARGLSNQEIADTLFVSLNTVKTHTSNVFLKLDAKRRTQAIQKAKELRLIP
ncbi:MULTISPECIES: response regulator transcription factor [unclassified Spirosoma]|uniref:helix-turn-helix transcriptional regulator n=1 Tax=unclassified Spirosoma TaxID=2621999 RepID=UPI000966E5C2|nr:MULTISPECIES: response regulator transcription factor [unclassified Spirosoma]MBN8820590.1 response regulator transcription factor [Spirosoma sp.]OJW76082.1 MAG: helix-turn-helix transcriptional regulator [Spirosoma sp. 48-14]